MTTETYIYKVYFKRFTYVPSKNLCFPLLTFVSRTSYKRKDKSWELFKDDFESWPKECAGGRTQRKEERSYEIKLCLLHLVQVIDETGSVEGSGSPLSRFNVRGPSVVEISILPLQSRLVETKFHKC